MVICRSPVHCIWAIVEEGLRESSVVGQGSTTEQGFPVKENAFGPVIGQDI